MVMEALVIPLVLLLSLAQQILVGEVVVELHRVRMVQQRVPVNSK